MLGWPIAIRATVSHPRSQTSSALPKQTTPPTSRMYSSTRFPAASRNGSISPPDPTHPAHSGMRFEVWTSRAGREISEPKGELSRWRTTRGDHSGFHNGERWPERTPRRTFRPEIGATAAAKVIHVRGAATAALPNRNGIGANSLEIVQIQAGTRFLGSATQSKRDSLTSFPGASRKEKARNTPLGMKASEAQRQSSPAHPAKTRPGSG